MKIVYFPEGSESLASSRLRCYKPGKALAAMGHQVEFNPGQLSDADFVIVQKKAWERFGRDGMAALKQTGAYLVWDIDDLYEWQNPPIDIVDAITVDTAAKLAVYPDAIVIPDCLDVDDNAPRKIQHADTLRSLVWYGGGDNTYHLSYALEAAQRLKLDVTLITNLAGSSLNIGSYYNVTGLQWDIASVDAEIIKADLVICPHIFDGTHSRQWIESKSANRLYKAWGLGMPVAGTAIPSYRTAGLDYYAETVLDWLDVFEDLRSKQARGMAAERGYKLAQTQRASEIARLWLNAFEVAHV